MDRLHSAFLFRKSTWMRESFFGNGVNKMEDVIKIYHASNDVDAEIILERLRDCGIEGYISEAHSVYPKIYSGSMNGSVIWGSDIYINAQDEERARELLQQWDREAEKDVEILSDQARNAKEIPEDVQEFLAQRADSKMGDEDRKDGVELQCDYDKEVHDQKKQMHKKLSVRRIIAQLTAVFILLFLIVYFITCFI